MHNTPSSIRLTLWLLALCSGTPAAADPLTTRADAQLRIHRGEVHAQTAFLTASGGRAPYTFSLNAEALPAGIAVSPAGAVSGVTCSAEGSYPLGVVTVTDAQGVSVADTSSQLVVEAAVDGGCSLSLEPALPSPMVGQPLKAQLSVGGGTAPYTFALASGALPAGLALSPHGELSGKPTASAMQQVTLFVRDATGATGAHTATIVVMAVAITPPSLGGGTVGAAYGQSLSAAGGNAPYRFSVSAGSLPPGLSLSPAGRLTGTPIAAGRARFSVSATDAGGATATRSYAITIGAAPRSAWGSWRGSSVLVPMTAAAGHTTIGAPGQPVAAPIHTPSWSRDARPSGTSAGHERGTSVAAALDVQPRVLAPPQAGVMFSGFVVASGGVPPYRFDVVGGNLPPGMVLESTGQVWGRPWRPGIDDLTLRVTDANGDTLSVSLQVNVGARPDPTTDATVAGLQTAENEALKRLSTAQMQNVWSRLDGDVDCRPEWEQRIRLNAGWRDARPYGAPEAAAPGSADQRTCSRSLSMWAAGTVDYGRLAGSSASTGNRFSTPGLTAGVDLMPLSGLRSGIALGHGQDRSDLGAGSRVDSRSDSITAYGSWQAPLGVRVHAALGQARTALDLQRAPTAASSMLQGQRRVSQRYAALAGSTRVDVGAWQLAPRMGVEYMKASLDGVAEGDGSPLALAYDPARLASSDLRGGLALRRQWRQALWTVEPEFSLDWHRRLQGGLTQPLRYGDDPAAPAYLLQISDPTDEFALLGLGVRMQHPRGWSLSFGARSTLDSGALRSDGYTAAMLWPF